MKPSKDYDDLDDWANLRGVKNVPQAELRPARLKARKNPKQKRTRQEVQADAETMIVQDDTQGTMDFTYKASRHEAVWLRDSLGGFFEHQWFTDVLRLLQGGKEASVYQCEANEPIEAEYLAAKVYRPARFRSLKNDAAYREGRVDLDEDGRMIKNHGMLHAIRKRTDWGRELSHTSWIEYEYKAMQTLFAAGADVPEPYACGNNAILMGYVGDDVTPAPLLVSVELERGQAQRLFRRVIENIEIMLANNLIHGDLSAYNILYWDGAITLIDFPQVVQPEANSNAYKIFERDVTRICEYFASQGVRTQPRRLAAEMWQDQGHRLAPEVHPRLLDADDPKDRLFWQRASK